MASRGASTYARLLRLMAATSKKGRQLPLVLFLCAIGLIGVSVGLAVFHKAPWVVPITEKARKNPLTPSDANLAAAKEIYDNKCSECHGDKGKGDGSDAMMYDPPPTDLTDVGKMSKLTDGEILYQITEGRKPMPSFKNKLTEEQRWQLVLLVRSFAAAPGAQGAAVPEEKKSEPASKPN
jgi:mono/diheme cytochrome c family protein